jgi:acyl-CoA hydrolase
MPAMAPRRCTPEEAAHLVHTRDTLAFGLGPGIAPAFFTALGERDDWEELIVGGALLLDYYKVLTKPGVSFRSGFFGPAERILSAEGYNVDLVPGGFRQFGPILSMFPPRIMAAQAAPADSAGNLNLSLHLGATYDELLAAGRDPERLLFIEVNPHLPRTRSLPPYDNTLPLDIVDVLIEVTDEPFTLEESIPDEIDTMIATNALMFVTDGATLQTGIGGVPSMVATRLAEGSGGDYGIHSEMFTNGLMRLHQAGKVTNAKGLYDGVSVATFALGSAELYRWLDDNPEVVFLPVEAVNEPSIIARNRKLVSVNGALAVDLYGQVVADCIDGEQISGVGGHEDFLAAADVNLDHNSLVCLRSTVTIGGELRSRIMSQLPEGTVVSTPRHHTSVVVTEYGAAKVTGMTVKERARALAQIAHPDFREELCAQAETLGPCC